MTGIDGAAATAPAPTALISASESLTGTEPVDPEPSRPGGAPPPLRAAAPAAPAAPDEAGSGRGASPEAFAAVSAPPLSGRPVLSAPRSPDATKTSDPPEAPAATPCAPLLIDAAPGRGATSRVRVSAPCAAGAVAILDHAGLVFPLPLDAAGEGAIDLPVLDVAAGATLRLPGGAAEPVALDHPGRDAGPEFCGDGALAAPAYLVIRAEGGRLRGATRRSLAAEPCDAARLAPSRLVSEALAEMRIE